MRCATWTRGSRRCACWRDLEAAKAQSRHSEVRRGGSADIPTGAETDVYRDVDIRRVVYGNRRGVQGRVGRGSSTSVVSKKVSPQVGGLVADASLVAALGPPACSNTTSPARRFRASRAFPHTSFTPTRPPDSSFDLCAYSLPPRRPSIFPNVGQRGCHHRPRHGRLHDRHSAGLYARPRLPLCPLALLIPWPVILSTIRNTTRGDVRTPLHHRAMS